MNAFSQFAPGASPGFWQYFMQNGGGVQQNPMNNFAQGLPQGGPMSDPLTGLPSQAQGFARGMPQGGPVSTRGAGFSMGPGSPQLPAAYQQPGMPAMSPQAQGGPPMGGGRVPAPYTPPGMPTAPAEGPSLIDQFLAKLPSMAVSRVVGATPQGRAAMAAGAVLAPVAANSDEDQRLAALRAAGIDPMTGQQAPQQAPNLPTFAQLPLPDLGQNAPTSAGLWDPNNLPLPSSSSQDSNSDKSKKKSSGKVPTPKPRPAGLLGSSDPLDDSVNYYANLMSNRGGSNR
jgi:hypothetical protein